MGTRAFACTSKDPQEVVMNPPLGRARCPSLLRHVKTPNLTFVSGFCFLAVTAADASTRSASTHVPGILFNARIIWQKLYSHSTNYDSLVFYRFLPRAIKSKGKELFSSRRFHIRLVELVVTEQLGHDLGIGRVAWAGGPAPWKRQAPL